jgi:hypothetical protein
MGVKPPQMVRGTECFRVAKMDFPRCDLEISVATTQQFATRKQVFGFYIS